MVKQPVLIALALIAGVALSSRPPSSGEAPANAQSDTAEVADAQPEPVPAPGTDTVTLQRDPDGHFYADAVVNGATIRFMVDTGASSVALSRADAARAGMFYGENDFNAVGRGAGGDVRLRPVTLDRIAVGPIEARQVRGVVLGDSDTSLLGQSFLATLGGVRIEGDTMVLRPA